MRNFYELQRCDLVKICRNEECFWLIVAGMYGDEEHLVGLVNNYLSFNHGYGIGDFIAFHPQEIIEVESTESMELYLARDELLNRRCQQLKSIYNN